MASSSRSFTGMRLPAGSACSLCSVPRYGVIPGSSWCLRSWATVSPMLVAVRGREHELLRGRAGQQLGDVDAARTGEDPEVALGDRDLAPLVRDELTPAQAGAARHLGQGQALPAAYRPQVLAQLLRVTVISSVVASAMPLRIGGCTASPVGSVVAVYALGDLEPRIDRRRPTSTPTRPSSGTSRSVPAATVWPQTVLRGDYGVITVGARTSVQDGTVLHTTPLLPDDRRRRLSSSVTSRTSSAAPCTTARSSAPARSCCTARWSSRARSSVRARWCRTTWSCRPARWRSACPRSSGPIRSTPTRPAHRRRTTCERRALPRRAPPPRLTDAQPFT